MAPCVIMERITRHIVSRQISGERVGKLVGNVYVTYTPISLPSLLFTYVYPEVKFSMLRYRVASQTVVSRSASTLLPEYNKHRNI